MDVAYSSEEDDDERKKCTVCSIIFIRLVIQMCSGSLIHRHRTDHPLQPLSLLTHAFIIAGEI